MGNFVGAWDAGCAQVAHIRDPLPVFVNEAGKAMCAGPKTEVGAGNNPAVPEGKNEEEKKNPSELSLEQCKKKYGNRCRIAVDPDYGYFS